ncbi:MAG: dethiobiotin synthase [Proteobacteria bacterium]|nr:dethiobiotin synthase [Pseudomonadota bacterium]
MKRYFITSSGTEVGKTLLTCALIRGLQAKGKSVSAQKPVISGWNESENDSYAIIDALGLKRNSETLKTVTLYRFDAPLSPDMAARRENATIDFEKLVAFCRASPESDVHLIEGAGGVMVPLNDMHHTLDLIKRSSASVILVVGSYLGAISHALTAYKVLRAEAVDIAAIVISESEISAVGIDEMATTMKNFVRAPIFLIHRLAKNARLENEVPEILRIVE